MAKGQIGVEKGIQEGAGKLNSASFRSRSNGELMVLIGRFE